MTKKRIDIIDALRGLAVLLMVAHHFLYDMVVFLGAPAWLFSNPILDLLHYVFAGLFIFLSGLSSQLSRSNVKRGVKVLLIAFAITIVTGLMDMTIRFGVLHLLGFCMVFYGLTRKIWDDIPEKIMPLLCVLLLIGSALAVNCISIGTTHLWMFGWRYAGFQSTDYFPIFPWLFVFLLGTWFGKFVVERRLPVWFYEKRIPVFPAVGKKALLIYILHQPVLYGITLAIKYGFGL